MIFCFQCHDRVWLHYRIRRERYIILKKYLFFCTQSFYFMVFFLTADDLIQTTTMTKLPGQKVRAQMDVESIKDLELHITNLLFGKQLLENILDKIINTTWQPGFVVTRRLINELVSTAFTEIFNNSFYNFPFEKIFKSNQSIS